MISYCTSVGNEWNSGESKSRSSGRISSMKCWSSSSVARRGSRREALPGPGPLELDVFDPEAAPPIAGGRKALSGSSGRRYGSCFRNFFLRCSPNSSKLGEPAPAPAPVAGDPSPPPRLAGESSPVGLLLAGVDSFLGPSSSSSSRYSAPSGIASPSSGLYPYSAWPLCSAETCCFSLCLRMPGMLRRHQHCTDQILGR